MAPDSASPPNRGGLSLYAHLLDPSGAQSASPAAVQQPSDAKDQEAAKKPANSGFRFQPTKRPQAQNKAKTKKPGFAPPSTWTTTSTSPDSAAKAAAQGNGGSGQPVAKTTLSDWIGDDDDDWEYYAGERRQRGGRRKKKKKKQEEDWDQAAPNWDAIYDFMRPTNFDEYKGSMEEFDEMLEWKNKLKAHLPRREPSSDEDDSARGRFQGYAPPASYSFAPPPEFTDSSVPANPSPDVAGDSTGEEAWARRSRLGGAQDPPLDSASPPPPPPPPAEVPTDSTGEDAYLRRLRMSSMQTSQDTPDSPPAPPLMSEAPSHEPHPPSQPSVASKAPSFKPAGRSILDYSTISSAAVRYEAPGKDADAAPAERDLDEMSADGENPPPIDDEVLPDAPEGDADSQPEPERSSNRPGQKGFAERYMAKFGYTKGTGLGATGSGILTPIVMKAEKRKRLPDSEGGGFRDRGGRGKIVGGKKAKTAEGEDEGKYGKMSDVVLIRGILDGMDVQKEIGEQLYQRIGDRCEKYGTIERIYIHQDSDESTTPVFIKYTNPVSALGAVNGLDGQDFEGNTFIPCFFDSDKFNKGIYT